MAACVFLFAFLLLRLRDWPTITVAVGAAVAGGGRRRAFLRKPHLLNFFLY